MATFSWARPAPLEITLRLPADQRIYLISDLHLGDGTRSDSFLGKDRELLALLARVREEGAHLVIAGDAIDFYQAWTMSRVLRAHARLIGELARMAESNGVTYIWGNHDYDMALFRDVLRFDVCSTLLIGDDAMVCHGYQYDPFIGPNLEQTHVATIFHHLVERILDSWIRLPIENFYTLPTRISFWLFHKLALAVYGMHGLASRVGIDTLFSGLRKTIWYWSQNQIGDPGCLLDGVVQRLETSEYRWVVAGHSHLPGKVELRPGRFYINTGSWTYNSSQYALWDGEGFVVRDWISGREYGDRVYRPLMNPALKEMTVLEWWRENYLGWLRFRGGEAKRASRLRPGDPLEAPPGAVFL